MSQEQKLHAARAAINYIEDNSIIGVGTGSTTNLFIDELGKIKHRIKGAVASSEASADRLKSLGIELLDLNSVGTLDLYVDGADEVDPNFNLIKGGGGALTREKIIAAASKRFVCIVDASKKVQVLGKFPLPIEVLPLARSYVAREILKLGADPEYRAGFVTDNGNVILDIKGLDLSQPLAMEQQLNQIAGVVTVGIFAQQRADILIVGTDKGTEISSRSDR